jgi:PAS domain S-box-containing protein
MGRLRGRLTVAWPRVSRLVAGRRAGVRVRVLIPLTVAIVLLTGAFTWALYRQAKDEMQRECAKTLDSVPKSLQKELDREAHMMAGVMDALTRNDRIRSAFEARDFEALLDLSQPLLRQLRRHNRISHFHFLDPERACFLRVHRPGRKGDTINRITVLGAERTGKMFHGIELGPLGTFTLRVVQPWYKDGRLLGYIELGEEIEDVISRLSGSAGVEIAIAIHKKFLDRAGWEEGMAMLGREADWNALGHAVVVTKTVPVAAESLDPYLCHGRHGFGVLDSLISLDDRTYGASLVELTDAGDRLVGGMLILRDETVACVALRQTVAEGLLLCLVIGGALFGLCYVYLGRVDRAFARGTAKLTDSNRELQEAEEVARSEYAKLSAMIAGMEEGVVFADADNVIVEINDFLCRFVGHSREEIVGRRIEDLHHGPVLKRVLGQIAQFRDHVDSPPLVLQRPLGEAEVILRMQPIYRDGGYDGVLLNVIDVTELVGARQAAETASESKTNFLANMSHEIRTPMTAIMGYADLLAETPNDPEERDRYLTIIRRNGKHLLSLINDLLDLSKIEAGEMTMVIRPCHLATVVADVASIMRVRADERGISLTIEYTTAIPEVVLTDSDRLRQALVNLVGNAVKFTEEGSVRIVVTLVPSWRDGQSAVRFEVIDSGIGMDRDAMDRLFEPFVQADASTSRKYGGTGLGLAITRRVAELLGGDVTVESAPGAGSSFTLIIPAGDLKGVAMLEDPAEAVHSYEDSDAEAVPAGGDPLVGVRVLLAEDGADNQLLISTVLRKAGAEVAIADNGRLAVEKALSEPFDVILMDIQMPEMNGYEATRALRVQGYTDPVLALTAHAMDADRERCLAAGCNEHLTKPINRQKMIRTVARFARRSTTPNRKAPTIEKAGRPEAKPDATVIRSEFADDADLAEIIDTFVSGLSAKARAMHDALSASAFEILRGLAHQMKGAGGSYGYAVLTDKARALENAAKARDAEAAALAWGEFAEICRAITCGRADTVSTEESR